MNYDREKANALPNVQRRVMLLLMSGDKLSVADICTSLRIADPRSHIRSLRAKGFRILDEWRETGMQNRYKVYYYKPSEQ